MTEDKDTPQPKVTPPEINPYKYLDKLKGLPQTQHELSEEERNQAKANKPLGQTYTYPSKIYDKLGEEFKPWTGKDLYSLYEKKLQEENDAKAAQQSWYGNLYRGTGNALSTLVTGVLSIPGYLGAMGEAAFTDKTIGETTDNAWINYFDSLKKDLGEDWFKTYVPTDIQDGRWYEKAMSGSWWATTGADAIGQMASLILPGQVFKAASFGAKASKSLGAAKLIKDEVKLGRFLNNADDVTAATFNASLEASMEAKESFQNVYAQLKTKVDSGEMTDEEARQVAGEQASNVFMTNMLLLSGTNMFDQKWLFSGFKGKSFIDKKLAGALSEEAVKPAGKKWYNYIPSTAGTVGKGFLKEGFLEEGTQYATQKYFEDKALGKESDPNWVTGILGKYIDSMDENEFQESVFLGGILGSPMGLIGKVNENKYTKEFLYGKDAKTPNAVQRFLGKKAQKSSEGVLKILKDNYIQNFDNASDIYQKDANGNLILDENNKPKIDNAKRAEVLMDFIKKDALNLKMMQAKLIGREDLYSIYKDVSLFNFMRPYMNIEGGREVFNQHVEEIAKREQKNLEALYGDNRSVAEIKTELQSKFVEFQNQHMRLERTSDKINKLSKEETKDTPEFTRVLNNSLMYSYFEQSNLKKELSKLEAEITELEQSDLQLNHKLAEPLKKQKETLEKKAKESEAEALKLYTKEGQKTLLDKYSAERKENKEILEETEADETIIEDAGNIKNIDHSEIYRKGTIIDPKTNKKYHGGVEITEENGNSYLADIVGFENGELKVRDKSGRTFTITKNGTINGTEVTVKNSYPPKPPVKAPKTTTPVITSDTTEVNQEEAYDVNPNKNYKDEPHAPFTGSLTDFLRTKGNQEEHQKNPNKYKPYLEFYKFIDNYDLSTPEHSDEYKYLRAFTFNTIPTDVKNRLPKPLLEEWKSYPSNIHLFVMQGNSFYLQNSSYVVMHLPEPLLNGDVEPVNRESGFPLFSYDKYKASNNNLSDEQVTQDLQLAAEDFTAFRDRIFKSPVPVDFKFTSKNKGVLVKEKNTVPSSVIGKIVNTEQELGDINLFISTEDHDKGLVFIHHKDIKLPVVRTTLSDADVKSVVEIMKLYASTDEEFVREQMHKALKSFVHINYQSKGQKSESKYNFYPIQTKKGEVTGFKYGEWTITREELLAGNTDHLENKFLKEKLYSVDKELLAESNNKKSFTKYTVKDGKVQETLYTHKEGGYKKFLFEGENPKLQVTIRPLSETQFLNRSFNIDPINLPVPQLTKKEIELIQEDVENPPVITDEFDPTDSIDIDTIEDPDNLFKAYSPSDILGTSPEELKWFKDKFKGFDLRFIQNGLINGIGVAAVTKNMEVLITEYITQGTLYHEAFHVVNQFFNSSKTRKKLYDEVRQRTGKDFTDLQAEEFLADEFQSYMENPKTYKFNKGTEVQQSVFQRIWSAIKRFFGVSSVEDMFQQIIESKYSKSDAINKPEDFQYLYKIGTLDETTSRRLLEHFNVLFFDRLFNTKGFSAKALLELDVEKMNAVYTELKTALQKSNVAVNKQILFHVDEIEKQHRDFLKQYGLTWEYEKPENVQFVEGNTVPIGVTMPSPVKFLIAGLSEREKTKGLYGTVKKSPEGFVKKVDFDATINLLTRELSNLPEEHIFPKLAELYNTGKHPEFKNLLDRLGVPIDTHKFNESGKIQFTSTISPEASKETVMLQVMFKNTFRMSNTNPIITILTKDEKAIQMNAAQDTIEAKILAKWKSNLKVEGNNFFKFKEGNYVLDKEELYTLPNGKKVPLLSVHTEGEIAKTFPRYKDVQNYLSVFGITFTEDNQATEIGRKIIRFLSENLSSLEKVTIDDVYKKDTGKVNKEIKELADIELTYSKDNISNQYINGKGQTEYVSALPNKLSHVITDITHDNAKDFAPYSSATPDGNIQTIHHNWNYDNMKLVMLRSAKPDYEDAIDIDQTKKGDFMVVEVNAVLKGINPFLRAADRGLEYGFAGDKPSRAEMTISEQRFVEELIPYVQNEVVVALAYQNDPLAKHLVKSGKVNTELQFFRSILPKLEIKKESTDYLKDAKDIVDNNLHYIREELKKFVQKATKDNLQLFYDSRLIENNKVEVTNLGFAPEIINYYSTNGKLTEFSATQLARAFTYLYLRSGLDQVKHIMGTVGTFTKQGEFHKRTTTAASTKGTTANAKDYVDFLNKEYTRADGFQHEQNYRDFVYDDTEVTSSLKDTLKNLGIEGYDKPMTENDAQGWTSLDGYRALMLRSGKWTTGMEMTYQYEIQSFIYNEIYNNKELLEKTRLTKERIDEIFSKHLTEGWKGIPQFEGKDISIEELTELVPQKPQGVGHIQNPGLKTFGTVQITKTSVAPLLYSNLRNSTGKQLMIDMIVNGIDFVFPKSAKKGEILGNQEGKLAKLYKEDGSVNTISESLKQGHLIEEISWSDIGIQLDIDPPGKEKVTQSIQMESIKTVNIYDKGEVRSEVADLEPFVLEDKALKDQRKDILLQRLRDDLGLVKIDGKYQIDNKEKFLQTLEQEFRRKNYSDNVLQGIKQVVYSDLQNFDTINVSEKVDNLLTSLINNNLVRQKVKGDMLVQQASTLYETEARNPESSNFLKTYEPILDEEGNIIEVKPAESMVRLPKEWIKLVEKEEGKTFVDKLDNFNKKIQNKSWDKLLTIASNRTPTQDLNSMEVMRIKKFLVPWSGSTIILPSEIVVKAGSDFDIDKLSEYLNSYKFDKEGNPIYLEEGSVEERYVQYIKEKFFAYQEDNFLLSDKKQALQFYNDKVNAIVLRLLENGTYKNLTKEELKQVRAEEKSIAFEEIAEDFNFMSFDEFSKLPKAKQLSIEQIDNKINQNSIKFILHPANYKSLMTPNGSEIINKAANKFQAEKPAGQLIDLLSFRTNMEYGFAQWKAQAVLGTAANNVSFHSKVQKSPINLNTELIRIPFKEASTSLGNIYSADNQLISILLGQYVSATVDAAKETHPALSRANVSPSTGNLTMLLTSLGVKIDDIFGFLTSDIITKFETLRERDEAKFLQVQQLQKYKSQIVTELTGVKGKDQKNWLHNIFKGIMEQNDKYSLEDFNKRYNEKFSEGIPDNHKDKLELFLYLIEVSKYYGDLVQLTKQDAGMPKNRDTVTFREEKLQKLIKSGLFQGIEQFFENTYMGKFREVQLEGTSMFDQMFTRTSDERFSDFIFKMMLPYKKAKIKEDILISTQRKLTKRALAYILHTQKVNNQTITDKYEELLFGNNNLAKRILKLKNSSNPVKDNVFIQELVPVISEYLDRSKENLTFDYIRRFSSKLSTFEEDSLAQGFKEIMDSNDPEIQQLGTDIVYASIIQSGLNKSNNSFFDSIPVEYFYPLASEALKAFKDSDFNFLNDEAMEIIYQNSWMDKDIVKRQNAFMKVGNEHKYLLSANSTVLKLNPTHTNSNYDYLTVELKNEETKGKDTFLFKKEGQVLITESTEFGTREVPYILYNKINKKGQGNKFSEYTSPDKPSLIKNNNTKKEVKVTVENISTELDESKTEDSVETEFLQSLIKDFKEDVAEDIITITEEQLQNINNNLSKAGFRNITMEEFNNMSPERQKKAIECYG